MSAEAEARRNPTFGGPSRARLSDYAALIRPTGGLERVQQRTVGRVRRAGTPSEVVRRGRGAP
ncbi:hypothetical protein THIOKS11490003 [Thiocapsa sp. KS1]|nr:hypothetical protein THIOKS11490003 [Thiocapsa sp. KS1]